MTAASSSARQASDYQTFLAAKMQHGDGDGFPPTVMPDFLFPFQRELVDWAVRMGRAAIFADCGLGKTPMQLAWAQNVHQHTGRPILIVTPLAVSFQTVREAEKFGIEAATSRTGRVTAPITVTNYEQLEKFRPDQFAGIVCDESSAIKSFDGQRRAIVTEFMRTLPYRLLCTATAAPNDYVELGTSSEALGYLGHMDMLSRFFVNDQHTSKAVRHYDGATWRFKGHAQDAFWRWVTSWARAIRRPSDLGYPDDGFTLPPLDIRQDIVATHGLRGDGLFDLPAVGLRENRDEARASIVERCERAAELLADAGPGVAWCQLNAESELLTRLIPGAVEVAGSDDPASKEEKLIAFSQGQIRVLVTKPKLGAWGLNWQHCHRMTYFPSFSYEQMYQAVRRSWRFGQQHPVTVDVVTTAGGVNVLKSLQRKSEQADVMFDALVLHMRDATGVRRTEPFNTTVEVPSWAK